MDTIPNKNVWIHTNKKFERKNNLVTSCNHLFIFLFHYVYNQIFLFKVMLVFIKIR